jgi:hypothetical protein
MQKFNKREVLKRIIIIPDKGRRDFWKREYKLLNDLLENYPDLDFWQKVQFHQEWDSLRILKSDYGKKILDKKYREFHYILPTKTKYTLGDKCGPDSNIKKKPTTIREFLL